MGLLSWLFGRPAPRSDLFLIGAGDYGFEVVGESNYQEALSKICGGPCEDGHEHECIARLVPEPTNRFDKNAVMVVIEGMTVAYLARNDAKEYLRNLRFLGSARRVASCKALINGGWDRGTRGAGHFGVELDISWPPRTR